MNTGAAIHTIHEENKELVEILLNSALYLDLDLHERYQLIRFLADCYFHGSHD